MPWNIWRVLSQNELSAIFDIFKVRAPSYNTEWYLSNDTFLIIYKGIFWKLWSKVLQIFLLFSLYFSSLNLKYLKLIKMELTRFAMKLFICVDAIIRFLITPEAKICRNKPEMAAILDSNMATILYSIISNTQDTQIIVGKCFSCPKTLCKVTTIRFLTTPKVKKKKM